MEAFRDDGDIIGTARLKTWSSDGLPSPLFSVHTDVAVISSLRCESDCLPHTVHAQSPSPHSTMPCPGMLIMASDQALELRVFCHLKWKRFG